MEETLTGPGRERRGPYLKRGVSPVLLVVSSRGGGGGNRINKQARKRNLFRSSISEKSTRRFRSSGKKRNGERSQKPACATGRLYKKEEKEGESRALHWGVRLIKKKKEKKEGKCWPWNGGAKDKSVRKRERKERRGGAETVPTRQRKVSRRKKKEKRRLFLDINLIGEKVSSTRQKGKSVRGGGTFFSREGPVMLASFCRFGRLKTSARRSGKTQIGPLANGWNGSDPRRSDSREAPFSTTAEETAYPKGKRGPGYEEKNNQVGLQRHFTRRNRPTVPSPAIRDLP